jgi:hypothetical protein
MPTLKRDLPLNVSYKEQCSILLKYLCLHSGAAHLISNPAHLFQKCLLTTSSRAGSVKIRCRSKGRWYGANSNLNHGRNTMSTLESAAAASAALISIRCHQAGNQLHAVSNTIARRPLLIVSCSNRKQHCWTRNHWQSGSRGQRCQDMTASVLEPKLEAA